MKDSASWSGNGIADVSEELSAFFTVPTDIFTAP
jgi:hypothetical protein